VTLKVLSEPARASADLPVLNEADLDWDGLDCVLADLDDFAEITELQGRDATGQVESLTDLLHAREQFLAGTLHGLQITYIFADQTWVDTLLRQPGGARLLRMASSSQTKKLRS
jgi:hypothetical protein